MAITRGDLVMMDANVLLASVNTLRADHEVSRHVFSHTLEEGIHLATCGQILREYLVVATRPVEVNGLGQSTADALKNIDWFRKRLVFFEEPEAIHRNQFSLMKSRRIIGKRIHDANIIALMRHYCIRYLITNNPKDYSEFPAITSET